MSQPDPQDSRSLNAEVDRARAALKERIALSLKTIAESKALLLQLDEDEQTRKAERKKTKSDDA